MTSFSFPSGTGGFNIYLEEKRNQIYVCGYSSCKILVYTTNGKFIREWGTGRDPFGITSGFGKIYIGLTKDIEVYTLKGKLKEKWSCSTLDLPYTMMIDNNDCLFIVSCRNGHINIFEPNFY